MFQNINENTMRMDQEKEKNEKNKLNILRNVFTKDNIVIYLVTFLLSFVGLGGEFSIFSISILAACLASSIPALGIVLISLIGNAICFGTGGLLGYFLTMLVMVMTLFIFKPRYNEQERNEKIKVGKNVLISVLSIQIIKYAITGFTLYDILSSITLAIIAVVFYKIFVNSIVVLKEFYTRRAFSIEEVIGASLLLAIAVGGIGDISIFGFSIRNVLSILIVMVLGWKNGILVGTTSGVTIGVTMGVITGTEPIMIAAYAISGMIAGILNRFGKIGVVIGFALGNIVLAYVSNGYTVELIHFKEILIASIGLLAVPKNLQIDLEEFVGNSKFLPVVPGRALGKSKEVANNLNNVSEALEEMANKYDNSEDIETEEIKSEKNKQIFITELLNTLEPYKDNMLYEDIANTEGQIINEIFLYLVDNQEINSEELLKIFAKCNSYIVGFDDKDISKYLKENISQMVRAINISYKVSKSEFIWRKRVAQNQKNIGKQLKGVSQAIQSMAKDLAQEEKAEKEYEKEKTQIITFLKQKQIEVQDIVINKEKRNIIEIYFNEILETAKIETVEKVLTKVLNEKIVLYDEAEIGQKLNFISDDKYVMAIGKASKTKSKSEDSGDSMLQVRLKDGKYLVAISDGMGSGKEAKQSSIQTLNLLENLLLSGFDKKVSLGLINSALMNQNKETFATLDIAIADLYTGNIEFIKSGACPTYIKNKKRVQVIKSSSLPTGIVEELKIETFDRDIQRGDIVLMCSDGILDSNIEYKNKELWVKYMLEDVETTNTQKIADLLLNEAIDNNFGVAKDDMSVIVCKFMEK